MITPGLGTSPITVSQMGEEVPMEHGAAVTVSHEA